MSSRSTTESTRRDEKPTRPIESPTLDAVFSALSHAARRRMLIILHARGGEMTAGQMADRFKHSWPTTTRHLGVLEKAGIVEAGKRGRHRFYKLKRHDLVMAADWLSSWTKHESGPAHGALAHGPYATMRNAIPQERESEDEDA